MMGIVWNRIKVDKTYIAHTHTQTHIHLHTHTPHGVVVVWPPARQGAVAVCERCDLPVIEPHCNLLLEQGWPSYGWRRVGLSDGGRVIGRAKKEGINFYMGVWYMFYVKSSVKQTGPRVSREFAAVAPGTQPAPPRVCLLEHVNAQRRTAVHWVLLLGPL